MPSEMVNKWLHNIAVGLLVFGTALVLFALVAFFGPFMESRHLPVVSSVKIEEIKRVGDRLEFSMYGTKSRPCKLIEANVMVLIHKRWVLADITVDGSPIQQRTRPVGEQSFGRWSVYPIGTSARVIALHDCHPLWNTLTVLAEFNTRVEM